MKYRNLLFSSMLMLALCFSIVVGCIQAKAHNELSNKLVRLHIIANSNSEYDQQLKIKVRDAILAKEINEICSEKELNEITETAQLCLQDNGCSQTVKTSFVNMYFETKHYKDFSLPAGYYDAIRVVIGEGKGENWWCVVYPSLCTSLAEAEGNLSEEEISYIKCDGKIYIVRFKLQEMISKMSKNFLKK